MEIKNIKQAVSKAVEEKNEIVAVYLYGSISEDIEHDRSDVDLALLMEKQPENMYELRVASEVYQNLENKREVDVRILNDSGLRFKHQVLKNGCRIYTRDLEKVIRFEENFYKSYLDKKPFIEEHDRLRRQRMEA